MGASTVTAGNVGQWGGKDTRMERVLGRYSALTIELNRGVLIGGRGEWRVVRAHVENRGGQMRDAIPIVVDKRKEGPLSFRG